MFQNRNIYRNKVERKGLVSFKLTIKETDLMIHAKRDLTKEATKSILKYRQYIESYIENYPEFATSLLPWDKKVFAHEIIRRMSEAGRRAGVGPMAAVAGAVAEYAGRELAAFSDELIIENGGDTYLNVSGPITIGVFAGKSPLSMKLGLQFDQPGKPFSVCTSSGTIGHSLSLGQADAVCVVSDSALTADAAATAIANYVKTEEEINHAVNFGKTIKDVDGILVIKNDKIGMWGKINIVKLKNT